MQAKRFEIREITPDEMMCGAALCPAIYESVREVTPEAMVCGIGICPAIYEALENVTSDDMDCAPFPVCPTIYQTSERYLVIGKTLSVEEAGLAGKVEQGWEAIEVPRALIDSRKK